MTLASKKGWGVACQGIPTGDIIYRDINLIQMYWK